MWVIEVPVVEILLGAAVVRSLMMTYEFTWECWVVYKIFWH